MSEPRYQLLDGDEAVQGCHTAERLTQLAHKHALSPWFRVLDLQTMRPCTLGDLVPGLAGSDAPAAPPHSDSGVLPLGMPDGEATLTMAPAEQGGASGEESVESGRRPSGEIAVGTVWEDLEFGRRLGSGAMGTVYEGRLQRDDETVPVAIKLLPVEAEEDAGAVRRFAREADLLARIASPHVVRIFKHGRYGERHAIVMELVRGMSLRQYLERGRRPSLAETLAWTTAVARALWETGKQGLVHRDVKPANIMLSSAGQVKLTDFGIARSRAGSSTRLTMTGAVIGTITYMSPEQAQGDEADHRSDIYSLGIVLYELLAGHPPFQGQSIAALLLQHCKEEAAPLTDPHLPPAIHEIVRRCLAKDPSARYQSSMDLVRDLEALRKALDGASAGPRPASGPPPVVRQRPAGRSGWPTLLIVLLVLGATIGGGAWWVGRAPPGQEEHATPSPTPPPPLLATPPPAPPPAVPAPDPLPTVDAYAEAALRYRSAVAATTWADAHAAASVCLAEDDERARREGLRLPTTIDSVPSGARIMQGTRLIGRCPHTIQLHPGEEIDLTLLLDGFAPHSLRLDGAAALARLDLHPVPGLRWARILAAAPLQPPLVAGRRLIVNTGDALYAVQGGDGRSVALPVTGDEIGTSPILAAHADRCLLVGGEGVIGLDPGTGQRLWQIGLGLSGSGDCRTPHVARHELVDGQFKCYLPCRDRLLAFLLDGDRITRLADTALGARASAGPAVVQVDVALSTLLQPIGTALLAFNGATVVEEGPLEELFRIEVGAPVDLPPLPLWHEDAPCFVVLARGGAGHLYDARTDCPRSRRIRANWHHGRSAVWPPVRLGESLRIAIALKDQRLVCTDLTGGGSTLWEQDLPAPLVGSPVPLGEDLLVLDEHGSLRRLLGEDGTTRWEATLGGSAAAGPWLVDGTIMVLLPGAILIGIDLPR